MYKRIPLEAGTIVNRKYKIKELLSDAGSSCLVYKAHPVLDNGSIDQQNPLIIKEFYPMNWTIERNVASSEMKPCLDVLTKAFQREAELFCDQITCNNVSGYDEETDTRYTTFLHMTSFTENGTGYIVISSIHGTTLEERMSLHTFSIAEHEGEERNAFVELIDIMQCIADAVEFQHRAGFLNLDLKPDNLLICRVGQSYLTHILDFGSSFPYRENDLTQMKMEILAKRLSQSAGYSSPRLQKAFCLAKKNWKRNDTAAEMFLQAVGQLSPADDVYSLCKIFQEMIFGKCEDDYRAKMESISWLNQVERDYLAELLGAGEDVTKEHNIENLKEKLRQFKDILTRDSASKKSLEDSIVFDTELFFDMENVQAFSQVGTAGSVFKIRKIKQENAIEVDVNFEKTRTRQAIPDYAGVFYKQRPVADVRTLSVIEFEACGIGTGLDGLQVEIKPQGFKWMHEIFPITLSEQYEKFRIETNKFAYPETLGCMEEITFVITPDHFTDEACLQGCFAIRNLRIK